MKTLYIIPSPYYHDNVKIKVHTTIENVVSVKTENIKIKDFVYKTKTTYVLADGTTDSTFDTVTDKYPKNSIDITGKRVLPFFVNLIQDLPSRKMFEAKEYKNAQLLVERRGGYQFYAHADSESPLLMAFNSYCPTEWL